ncbi:MAG: S-layer homology domain-containing protein [Clostridia bacterium]|nr:S-layer homology domain-containing protein [Clostridia bacterium]
MKLSKVLSLVLAIAMLLSVPTFAYTDVAADANYAEAVTVLSALNIFTGYEDGSFKPEGKITRAEYAAIVCRVNNMDEAAKANKVGGIFTDVAADHWASGYIASASQAGIVNGMGDGTFAPEAEVTYEQAVKMLVAALGYEMKAQSMGGYPTGYMMIANQESITVGTTNTAGGASRATVARLTYNAMTVPMMDQTSWGTDVKVEPIKTQSLLYTKLNALKAEVTFTSIPLDKTATDVTLSYTATNCDAVTQANIAAGNLTLNPNVKINGVDLTGLQGLTATAIIDKADSSAWKLIAVVPKAGKNVEITVDPELLQEVTVTDGYIEYKKTADDDRNSKIKVPATGLTVYKNLVAGSWSTDVAVGGNTGDVAYRFTDTDNDGTYETVFVDNIGLFVVGSVNEKAFKIYRDTTSANAMSSYAGGSFITLDPEVETVAWTLTDAEGNALELADIEAGSVAAVAYSTDGTNDYYEIVISKDTIEGTVAQVYTENSKTYYTIGDADYTMLTTGYTLNPGDAIVATVYGDKIVNYDVAEGVKNYGIVIATNLSQDFGNTWQLQVLTMAGEIVTLDMAEKVNGTTYAGTDFDYTTAQTSKDLIIAYELNNAGDIKAYNFESGSSFNATTVVDNDKLAGVAAAGAYKETSEKLDSLYITEDTVVVITENAKGSNNKEDYAMATADIFDETETYTYRAVYDENREAKFVVLYQVMNNVNMNAFPLVVTKTSTVTVDNDYRTKYTGYINGEEVELIAAEGATLTMAANDVAMIATNAAGEITGEEILAKYSTSGYTVVDNTANAADDEKTPKAGTEQRINFAITEDVATGLGSFFTAGSADTLKGFGAVGKVYTTKGKTLRLVSPANYANTTATVIDGNTVRNYNNEAWIDDYSINPAAVAYVFNKATGKIKVATIGDIETEVNTNDYKVTTQLENDDAVYVYNYDGDTKLIFIVDVKGN